MASPKKSPSRIYAVIRKGHGTTRLVRATTWAGALRHVAKDEYTVTPAEQDQLVVAVQRGVTVEVADAETTQPPAALVLQVNGSAPAGDQVGYQGATALAGTV